MIASARLPPQPIWKSIQVEAGAPRHGSVGLPTAAASCSDRRCSYIRVCSSPPPLTAAADAEGGGGRKRRPALSSQTTADLRASQTCASRGCEGALTHQHQGWLTLVTLQHCNFMSQGLNYQLMSHDNLAMLESTNIESLSIYQKELHIFIFLYLIQWFYLLTNNNNLFTILLQGFLHKKEKVQHDSHRISILFTFNLHRMLFSDSICTSTYWFLRVC